MKALIIILALASQSLFAAPVTLFSNLELKEGKDYPLIVITKDESKYQAQIREEKYQFTHEELSEKIESIRFWAYGMGGLEASLLAFFFILQPIYLLKKKRFVFKDWAQEAGTEGAIIAGLPLFFPSLNPFYDFKLAGEGDAILEEHINNVDSMDEFADRLEELLEDFKIK